MLRRAAEKEIQREMGAVDRPSNDGTPRGEQTAQTCDIAWFRQQSHKKTGFWCDSPWLGV
jgi:hypothetical protein